MPLPDTFKSMCVPVSFHHATGSCSDSAKASLMAVMASAHSLMLCAGIRSDSVGHYAFVNASSAMRNASSLVMVSPCFDCIRCNFVVIG